MVNGLLNSAGNLLCPLLAFEPDRYRTLSNGEPPPPIDADDGGGARLWTLPAAGPTLAGGSNVDDDAAPSPADRDRLAYGLTSPSSDRPPFFLFFDA